MKAILVKDNKVFNIIEQVEEVGEDYIVGEKTLRGINTNIIDILVVDDEEIGDLKKGDNFPAGLVDKKALLTKPTLEDVVRELALTKLEIIKLKGGNA